MPNIFTAFLEFKNEDTITRKIGLVAFLVITVSLALLAVSGAVASSSGDWFAWVIRIAYSTLIFGAETLAAIIFVRAVNAGSRKKAAVCFAIWAGLSWTCVQNAKEGAHVIFPNRYASSSQLSAEANLASQEADTLALAQAAAINSVPTELALVRKDIADLRVEQDILGNMSPEGVEKAQTLLQSKGLYNYTVDGISNTFTESARRERGEQIQKELAKLKAREDGFMAGQASPVQQSTTDKNLLEIAKAEAAAQAWWYGIKLEIMLWVLEIARSMGLWAAFTNVTASELSRQRARMDEIAEAEHQAKLRIINAGAPPTPQVFQAAPVVVPDEPPPEPTLEPPPLPANDEVEQTADDEFDIEAQRAAAAKALSDRMREIGAKGNDAKAHYAEAEEDLADMKVPTEDWRNRFDVQEAA